MAVKEEGVLPELPCGAPTSAAPEALPSGLKRGRDIYLRDGCTFCRGHSFVQYDEQRPDGSFAPGPHMRCVNCKSEFKIPAKLLVSPAPDTPTPAGRPEGETPGGPEGPGNPNKSQQPT